ncbi:MAG: BON domain-containing protein [Kiritimatiellia bacterium]
MKSTCFSLVIAATVMLAAGGAVCAAEMDDQIVAAFNNSYVSRTYLKDDAIQVKCRNGVVTLSGAVADENHKSLAQETAASLPGVNSVDNQLISKIDRATEKEDARIARHAKITLLYHRNVSAKTGVEVKDGMVTLTGEAASQAQKELTAEYVKDIKGVKGVKNEMTVAAVPVPPEQPLSAKIDDASISAQVKMTLMSRRATSALRTKVSTENGVVTLSGTAANAAEKELAAKLVGDINGVSNVVNNMTIEPMSK